MIESGLQMSMLCMLVLVLHARVWMQQQCGNCKVNLDTNTVSVTDEVRESGSLIGRLR